MSSPSATAPKPSAQWSATYSPDPGTVRRVRYELRSALEPDGLASTSMGDALLVLAELVGNAVRHAQTEFTVTVFLTDAVLRIEVLDGDGRPPVLLGLDQESTSGRGLHLVSAIALDWGWYPSGGVEGSSGKVVWAELQVG